MIPNETEGIKFRSITARVDFNFHETKRRMDRLKNIEAFHETNGPSGTFF